MLATSQLDCGQINASKKLKRCFQMKNHLLKSQQVKVLNSEKLVILLHGKLTRTHLTFTTAKTKQFTAFNLEMKKTIHSHMKQSKV